MYASFGEKVDPCILVAGGVVSRVSVRIRIFAEVEGHGVVVETCRGGEGVGDAEGCR